MTVACAFVLPLMLLLPKVTVPPPLTLPAMPPMLTSLPNVSSQVIFGLHVTPLSVVLPVIVAASEPASTPKPLSNFITPSTVRLFTVAPPPIAAKRPRRLCR